MDNATNGAAIAALFKACSTEAEFCQALSKSLPDPRLAGLLWNCMKHVSNDSK